MGVFTHLAERDYYTEFSYPLNIDVLPLVRSLRSGRPAEAVSSVRPINLFNFTYLKSCQAKRPASIGIYLIKSVIT